jgi:hypothetical protein
MKHTLLALFSWISLLGVARAAEMMDLKTTIPPVQLEGTPVPIKVPNMAPELTKPPVLQVPAGTVNLAKGKPVTASDDFIIIGDLPMITDGEKEGGEGYYVELAPKKQWVQLDLGQEAEIHAIWLWHYHSQKRAYHDVIVQIANDPAFKTGATTVFNNDYDGSTGLGVGKDQPYIETNVGKPVKVNAVKGRYVRLYSAGNTSNEMNHYIEVEVFGLPAK